MENIAPQIHLNGLGSQVSQAYYRRGVAYAAILRPKDALKDLQIVVKKAPGDKDAKLKLAEAQRIVKRDAFERAIEVGDEPSAAEGLDLDSMAVDSDYDGVKLGKEMTQEFITDMIERFKNGKKLHKKYVYQIVIEVKKIVYDEATMVEMEIPDDSTMTVCGDTHGQFFSHLTIRSASHFLTSCNRSIFRFNGVVPTERPPD